MSERCFANKIGGNEVNKKEDTQKTVNGEEELKKFRGVVTHVRSKKGSGRSVKGDRSKGQNTKTIARRRVLEPNDNFRKEDFRGGKGCI